MSSNIHLFAEEGRVLLHYLLGKAPSLALIERYGRAVGQRGVAQALHLPALVHRFPSFVRFLEAPLKPRSRNQIVLRTRLDLAMALCEVSAEGNGLLWRSTRPTRLGVLAGMFSGILLDALAMPARLVASIAWKGRDDIG